MSKTRTSKENEAIKRLEKELDKELEKIAVPTRFDLVNGIVQSTVGVLAIISFFIILATGEEKILKWIPTLMLSIAFSIIGIANIIKYRTYKKLNCKNRE